MKIIGSFKILGIACCMATLMGCTNSKKVEVSAEFLEEQADILMEEKEYYEARTLYKILDEEYEVNVEKKLSKCVALISDEESLLKVDEVIDNFNYEEEYQYILDIDPNYEVEDQEGAAFKSKGIEFNYEEFTREPKSYLNERTSGYGAIYKVIMQEEDSVEFLVNLESNSTGSYNPNDTSKLVKIIHEFDNDNRQLKEADNTMFYGYFMGIDSCELKDGSIKKVPTIKAKRVTGLAG
ncbi:MAG: hypothetical protein ACRCWM_04260 [Sarcina sp.]